MSNSGTQSFNSSLSATGTCSNCGVTSDSTNGQLLCRSCLAQASRDPEMEQEFLDEDISLSEPEELGQALFQSDWLTIANLQNTPPRPLNLEHPISWSVYPEEEAETPRANQTHFDVHSTENSVYVGPPSERSVSRPHTAMDPAEDSQYPNYDTPPPTDQAEDTNSTASTASSHVDDMEYIAQFNSD